MEVIGRLIEMSKIKDFMGGKAFVMVLSLKLSCEIGKKIENPNDYSEILNHIFDGFSNGNPAEKNILLMKIPDILSDTLYSIKIKFVDAEYKKIYDDIQYLFEILKSYIIYKGILDEHQILIDNDMRDYKAVVDILYDCCDDGFIQCYNEDYILVTDDILSICDDEEYIEKMCYIKNLVAQVNA
jgi:hypothetical protein